MPKSTTAPVTASELASLFEIFSLWKKISDGRLKAQVVWEEPTRPGRYAGGTSQILKHFTETDVHVCTTHRIIDRSGDPLHWDEADIKVGSVTIAKVPASSQ